MTANPPNNMKHNAKKRWNVNFHADIHIKCHAIKMSATFIAQPFVLNFMTVDTNVLALVENALEAKYMRNAKVVVESCFLVVINALILAATYVLRVVRNASGSARTDSNVKRHVQKRAHHAKQNVFTDVIMSSVTRNATRYALKMLHAIRNVEKCFNVAISALAYVANNVFV